MDIYRNQVIYPGHSLCNSGLDSRAYDLPFVLFQLPKIFTSIIYLCKSRISIEYPLCAYFYTGDLECV